MPDEKGRLTEEEIRSVREKFTELERTRGSEITCEVCTNTTWIPATALVGLKSDIKLSLIHI